MASERGCRVEGTLEEQRVFRIAGAGGMGQGGEG